MVVVLAFELAERAGAAQLGAVQGAAAVAGVLDRARVWNLGKRDLNSGTESSKRPIEVTHLVPLSTKNCYFCSILGGYYLVLVTAQICCFEISRVVPICVATERYKTTQRAKKERRPTRADLSKIGMTISTGQ
jgi:hypothetical protein